MEIERVYYKHYRYRKNMVNQLVMGVLRKPYHYQKGTTKWEPSCKGGATECHLVLDNDEEIVTVAECSLKDNFVYAIGRNIAYGRALKVFNEQYEEIPF